MSKYTRTSFDIDLFDNHPWRIQPEVTKLNNTPNQSVRTLMLMTPISNGWSKGIQTVISVSRRPAVEY